MLSQDFLEEMAFLYYISYDFPQLQYSSAEFENVAQKKNQWQTLSETKKDEFRQKALQWVNDYQLKFPGKIEVVEGNWKKINWKFN